MSLQFCKCPGRKHPGRTHCLICLLPYPPDAPPTEEGTRECKYSPSGKHVAPREICQYCEEDVKRAPVATKGGWPCQSCGYGHEAETPCPPKQTVVAGTTVEEAALRKEIENHPRLDEVFRHLRDGETCYAAGVIIDILRPFIPSQPPAECNEKVINDEREIVGICGLKENHLGDCAPVTPVSQPSGEK